MQGRICDLRVEERAEADPARGGNWAIERAMIAMESSLLGMHSVNTSRLEAGWYRHLNIEMR